MSLTDQEIDLAAKVHYSFLPRDYSNDYAEIAVTAKPQGKIGGDYCSILPIDDKHLMVCMSDAVGHSLASALFAARINTFVLTHAFQEHSPCELTAILNQHLCQRLSDIGMYASFAAVFMDFENNVMEFAGAAHPPAVHYRSESADTELLSSETTLLGIRDPLPASCGSHHRKLRSGDWLVLYTDGLIDARDRHKIFYGIERLISFVESNHKLSVRDFNTALIQDVLKHCGSRAGDDILLVSIAVK